ncbi:MAG: hypothetical protein Q4C68_04825 [Moraxella sp.]|nr:hypothetical protein [Moraxella sp.]
MNKSILERIHALGGDISQTKGVSLIDDLQTITFKNVLHFKDNDEPFYDFYNFYKVNQSLNTNEFIDKAIAEYYISCDDEDSTVGQAFWRGYLFTPLTPNTIDYDEWHDDFDDMDLSQFLAVTNGQPPEFLILIYSYGYPDHYFICANDVSDNPTVFSTDHEVYFDEIENEGFLLDFLNRFMSKQESRTYIQNFLDEVKNIE